MGKETLHLTQASLLEATGGALLSDDAHQAFGHGGNYSHNISFPGYMFSSTSSLSGQFVCSRVHSPNAVSFSFSGPAGLSAFHTKLEAHAIQLRQEALSQIIMSLGGTEATGLREVLN